MEDDDEFGDLYTDVLRPFSSSLSSSASQPHRPSPLSQPPCRPPIDLNRSGIVGEGDKDAGNVGGGGGNSVPAEGNSAMGVRVLSSLEATSRPGGEDKDKELQFDIEEGNNGITEDSMMMIPGLGGDEGSVKNGGGEDARGGENWGEEEDSESEDDLQIVLNDTSNRGTRMGIEGDEDDDDDDDGEPLVIVADEDPSLGMAEEQDWGMKEEGSGAAGGAAGDGERKEGGEGAAGKVGGAGGVLGPKIGYSNHGYHHPFHSQFKVSSVGVAIVSCCCR